eukprot:1137980-Pelagomonas_calceolata.AAC.2
MGGTSNQESIRGINLLIRLHILLSMTAGPLYTALTKQLNASCKYTGPQRSADHHHQVQGSANGAQGKQKR